MGLEQTTRIHLVTDDSPPADVPAGAGPTGTESESGARRASMLAIAAVAALALAYGTRIALSLTAVVGRRAELLLSIQPGPLAMGGAALGLVLALSARRHVRRPRA